MTADTILNLAKQLDKIISGDKTDESALDILNVLKSLPVSLDDLQKTRIGMTVNELRRKVQDKDTQSEAKILIKKWKKMLGSKTTAKDTSGFPRTESIASNMSIDSNSNDVPDSATPMSQDSTDSGLKLKVDNNPIQLTKSGPNKTALFDDYRSKSKELLLKSLTCSELPEDSLDSEILATDIEQSIFNLFNSTSDRYRACIRSRVFNLRDKKNPELRENVLLGALKPEKLATMTPEEMASKDMKQLRKTFTKQAIDDHQVSQETGTPTDMFQCGKCRKKNCAYTQVQTRSADEPMTTFVYCRECGNRWKFC